MRRSSGSITFAICFVMVVVGVVALGVGLLIGSWL
ncbi:hypothetical protein VPHK469_0099 [Vibrio phage K469]